MQALCAHGFDGLHQWCLEAMPDPRPGEEDVVVQVEATAISYVDLLFARGRYQLQPALPFVPGTEFAGTVIACGARAAQRLQTGQRVTGTVFGGAWATQVRAPWMAVAPLAATDDARTACTLPVTYATALYALRRRGLLQPGETVLVLGAAGGVGMAAVQVARALGARVVAAASGAAKCSAALAMGAEAAVDSTRADWRSEVQAAAPQGIDVVVDPVGGALTDTAFRTLRWGGRHLVVGFAHGEIPALRANLPLLKGAAMVGVDVRQFREREPDAARDNLAEVADLFSRGLLKPVLAGVYSASAWASAMEAAARRETVGRVVIDWSSTA